MPNGPRAAHARRQDPEGRTLRTGMCRGSQYDAVGMRCVWAPVAASSTAQGVAQPMAAAIAGSARRNQHRNRKGPKKSTQDESTKVPFGLVPERGTLKEM
eukprot:scaffold15801_cov116-Isochrysis_galbana.AAC.1